MSVISKNKLYVTVYVILIIIVYFGIAVPISSEYHAPPVPPSPRWRYRPLIAGLRIEAPQADQRHVAVGSIGFPACVHINSMTYYGFVTAGHLYDNTYYGTTFQNTSIYFSNFVGLVHYAVDDGFFDFAFVWMSFDFSNDCSNYPPSKILPRFWYNNSGIVTYGFITDTWGSNPQQLIDKQIFKVGERTYTTFGRVFLVVATRVYYGGKSYVIYRVYFDALSGPGDSGGFVGIISTLAGAKLIGYVTQGGNGVTMAIYYNISNIFNVHPIVCPEGYYGGSC